MVAHVGGQVSLVHQSRDYIDVLLVFDLLDELDNAFWIPALAKPLLQHDEWYLVKIYIRLNVFVDHLDGNTGF